MATTATEISGLGATHHLAGVNCRSADHRRSSASMDGMTPAPSPAIRVQHPKPVASSMGGRSITTLSRFGSA